MTVEYPRGIEAPRSRTRFQTMATAQATRNNITLRGSTEIVTEFFGFAVNSILYQRGIYPPDLFKPVNKYGLTMLVTSDDGLRRYLSQVLSQISGLLIVRFCFNMSHHADTEWLMNGSIQKLVIVIASVATQQVLERWVFNIETDHAHSDARCVLCIVGKCENPMFH